MTDHPVCGDPECFTHGVAASLARQNEFYAANPRVDAGPGEE